jgi:hypothetical protein
MVAFMPDRVRILALYDIHGNVDALESVLGDARAADPDAPLTLEIDGVLRGRRRRPVALDRRRRAVVARDALRLRARR